MLSIFLDPILFACPRPSDSATDLTEFVARLLFLKDLRDYAAVEILMTERTSECLMHAERYPIFGDLQQIVVNNQILDFQPRDIVSLLNGLLQHTSTIENRIGISDYLYEDPIVSPAEFLASRAEPFRTAVCDVLVQMAFDLLVRGRTADESVLATIGAHETITISSEMLEVNWLRETRAEIPIPVSGSFLACRTTAELDRVFTAERLWIEGSNQASRETALRRVIADLKTLHSVPSEKQWRFGADFLESAAALQFCNDPARVRRLFRACAETVLDIKQSATHWLRTGPGANDSQRTRGNDRAWRRDIDYEFHLHYWETPTGVEFARVVTHNDYEI